MILNLKQNAKEEKGYRMSEYLLEDLEKITSSDVCFYSNPNTIVFKYEAN